MTWLFLQTWIWHLAAFLLGALITWVLFAQPWRRRRAATAGRHVNTEKRDGGSAKAELTAARKQVTALRADLESCRANRAAEADASNRELAELRAQLGGGAAVVDAPALNDTPLFDVDAPAPERAPLTGSSGGAQTLLSERPQTTVATEPYSTATEPYTVTTEQHGAVVVTGPYGAGSAAALPDGSAPEGFTIKGNADSGLFHTVDSPWYRRTKAEAWFDTEESAIAAGFTHWKRKK